MIFLELDVLTTVVRKLCAILCDIIYTLISRVYELFMTIARLNILSSEQIAPIYQRVTMILTIVMTFYITLEFVKYTINPDEFSDKEKGAGNILKRVIIVIGLIALTPTIFSTAYELQSRIIETNLISKMILGTSNTDYTSYGNDFSADMMSLFYYYDEEVCSSGGGECSDAEETVTDNIERIRTTGNSRIRDGINLKSSTSLFKETYPAIQFSGSGFIPLIIGGVILYVLLLYSIDVGVRYAQLIFLQLMAPVAIIGYIIPKKDGIFQKWGKQCISTYLDLFIRLIIINFVLLLVKILGDSFKDGYIFEGLGDVSSSLKVFTYIALVLGLLIFAQRAPKLLGELLPSGGGIGAGLNAKERMENMKKSLGGLRSPLGAGKKVVGAGRRVVGGVGGAIAGAARNKKYGIGAVYKGAAAGGKAGFSKDAKGLIGGSVWQRWRSANIASEGVRQAIEDFNMNAGKGANPNEAIFNSEKWKNKIKEYERRTGLLEAMVTKKKAVGSAVEDIKFRQQMETMGQMIEKANPTAGIEWVQVKKKADKLERQYADGKITASELQEGVNKLITNFNNDMAVRGIDVKASTISRGTISYQLDLAMDRMNNPTAVTEWNKVRTEAGKLDVDFKKAMDELSAKLSEKKISEAEYKVSAANLKVNYESGVNELITEFNQTMEKEKIDINVQANVVESSSDNFEIGSAKHATVHTALEEAKKVARVIASSGETYEDATGIHTIQYNEDTFAEDIGEITDNSAAAANQIKGSDDYKNAQAYAKGIEGGGSKK